MLDITNVPTGYKYPTTSKDFVGDYLNLMNFIFKLAPTQRAVLAEFVKIYLHYNKSLSDFSKEWVYEQTFSLLSKKEVERRLNFSSLNPVDVYINNFKKHNPKIITQDKYGHKTFHPKVIPPSSVIFFKFDIVDEPNINSVPIITNILNSAEGNLESLEENTNIAQK